MLHPPGGKLDRLVDLQVAGAAAKVSGERLADLLARRSGPVVQKRDAYEGIVRIVIEKGIRAREFAPCDVKIVTFAILGAMNWTARWYRPDGPQSPTEIATKFSNYLVRGLVR